nr:protein STICHEL-like 2 isoform X1 [Ipomoea batatas]GMD85064.1 protein STICHEL-like 2 isoform X1 [Ipomoea batatas]GME11774.1 protein STICHEL-like 2 isoform X1 [Ipomoea batatas]
MDGRRHSVDIPISRTLVALRRVKSLRDPSTNSMGKFSAFLENSNWETNSSNGISLGFEKNDNALFMRNEAYPGVKDPDCGVRKPNSKLESHETAGWVENGGSNGIIHAERPNLDQSTKAVVEKNKSPSERYCRVVTKQGLELACIASSNDCGEGGDSCNERNEESVQVANPPKKKSKYRNQYRSSRPAVDNVLNQLGSPQFSANGALEGSCHVMPQYDSEDFDIVDSVNHGCGISSCWLGTPRLRGSNLLPDVEEQPLLSGDGGETLLAGERGCWELYSNGVTSISESRNVYQKFRPKLFSELVGQSVVARSLLNTISTGRIHPFYLFHGPRGTGKTSASRIFAAALNCLSLDAEKPCGLCLECVLFFSGRNKDVVEVDCLKINKMERIRSVMKSAGIPPLSSRFKTFIFDECQLLREETWGTILSSLDELSRHVIFIMITPDLDKLPRTAVSRSQKYHFPKIKDIDIANHLGKICAEEGGEFDQDALEFIACKSNGSLRDGEMMLEQLSLLGKRISMPLVYELIGAVSDDELLELLHLALSSDTSNTVKRARELMRSRIDPMQLISQLANLIMDILAGKRVLGGRFSEASTQQLSHALKILSETEKQLRMSKSQTTWLTAALLQLSSVGSSMDLNEARLCSRTEYPQDLDGNFCSTSSTGESLKHVANCACESSESCQVRMQNDEETLTSIWSKAIAKCESHSLKNFLQRRGILSSICLKQGLAVAELKFSHPDYVSKAEKSWKSIANALQQTLCCNVEIRINLVNGAFPRKHARANKLSFSLFGCSRKKNNKSEISESGSDPSEISDFASKRIIKMDKVNDTCSSECVSQTQQKATVRTIRNNDGNALTIGMVNADWTDSMQLQHCFEVDYFNKGSNHGCKDFLALEPEKNHGCFPRSVKHLKRSYSSNESRMICPLGQQSGNWALSIPNKTSETQFCASDPHITCTRPINCCSGNIDISSRSSKFHCWRTVVSPFKKALRLKRQPENSHLQLVMPCAPAT